MHDSVLKRPMKIMRVPKRSLGGGGANHLILIVTTRNVSCFSIDKVKITFRKRLSF